MKLGLGERLFLAYLALALLVLGASALAGWSTALLWLSFAGFLVVGSIGFAFSLATSRSMRQIRAAAQRMAEGDAAEPSLPHGPGELGEVSRSLQAVSHQLQSQIDGVLAERDLREAILSSMDEAILVLRPDARLLFCNDAARRLLSLSEKVEEQPLVEFVRFPAILDAAYDATRGREASISFTVPGTPRKEVAGKAVQLSHRGGDPLVFITLRDVTDLRRLEAMRREFVANASHELRTPVTAIRGYAETLASGALDNREAAERFVQGLARQSERLSALIDDLLDLSRLESLQHRMHPRSLEVGELLSDLAESFRSQAEEKSIALRLEPVEEGLHVFADPEAVHMALGNLVENAIKYTPEHGAVSLRALREGATVRLDVVDTGPGIEARHLPHLFERFYRVDEGRGRGEGGTGLGLSIAKHAAQQSGGEVSVQSQLGVGSRFSLRLPGV